MDLHAEQGAMYVTRAAQEAQASAYGDEQYWACLDRSAREHYAYFVARGDLVRAELQFTRSLSEALAGNEGQ